MATDELFYFDAYMREFEATVINSDQDGRVLDRTAFYPRGGGKPADTGELRVKHKVWTVTKVKRGSGQIGHSVNGPPPEPGLSVHGSIDWDLRLRYMHLHTALHGLSAVVWLGWKANVTGANIADNGLSARMDFALEKVRVKDIKGGIEARLNMELSSGRAVKIYDLPRVEALELPDLISRRVNRVPQHLEGIRIVEIEGLDRQADGGTHVTNTQEVGSVTITNAVNKGRINRQLEISIEQVP